MSPMRDSDRNGPQAGSHGLWRLLAEVAALLTAGGVFVFMLTSLMFSL